MLQLRPLLRGKKVQSIDRYIQEVEQFFPLTPVYRELLTEFGGPIVFGEIVRFKADEPSSIDGAEGYIYLDRLFGLGRGEDTIIRKSLQYDGEVPISFTPLGELLGGNLVCADCDGKLFLWDHESDRDARTSKAADTLDKFLDKLEVDHSPLGDVPGLISMDLNF